MLFMIILSTVVKHTLKHWPLLLGHIVVTYQWTIWSYGDDSWDRIQKYSQREKDGDTWKRIGKAFKILCSELCSPCLIQKYFHTEFFSVVFKLCYILKQSFTLRDPGKHLCRVCTKQSVNLANLPAGPNLHRFTVFTAPKYLRNTLKLGLHWEK